MENSPSVLRQSPPFPDSSRTVDLSPLEFILALIAVITIPALIYAFFFSVKCPPWPFRRRRRHDHSSTVSSNSEIDVISVKTTESEVFSGVKYQKESHGKEIGSECPVCLSTFADGEDVKQLSACKHSFHASCIDMWFKSHSNCPICRAAVAVKQPSSNSTVAAYRDDDLHQGLPDASSLI